MKISLLRLSRSHRSRLPRPCPALSIAACLLAALLHPVRLQAQARDIGTGTSPAATTQNQTTPNGQNAPAATPDHTGLLDTGDQTDQVTVIGSLDEKRNEIVPNLGATSYGISQNQIANQSQGADAPFNQTLLRVPGFAQDSYGQLHVRGEHANLQYRINDVLLPEGITGFGQELDTRIRRQPPDHHRLAARAVRHPDTAGVIDIQTKSGAFDETATNSASTPAATTPSGPAFETGRHLRAR